MSSFCLILGRKGTIGICRSLTGQNLSWEDVIKTQHSTLKAQNSKIQTFHYPRSKERITFSVFVISPINRCKGGGSFLTNVGTAKICSSSKSSGF